MCVALSHLQSALENVQNNLAVMRRRPLVEQVPENVQHLLDQEQGLLDGIEILENNSGEIKRPLIQYYQGANEDQVPDGSYVITENNSINDILRHCIRKTSHDEVACLVAVLGDE